MRAPAQGASHASAGVLSPYIEATPGSALLTLGRHSLSLWDGWVQQIRSRTNQDFHYARTGTLDVALTREQAEALQTSAAFLAAERVPHAWLEGATLAAREPQVTPQALGGLFIAEHGHVDVGSLVVALMHAARLHGAVCQTPTEVLHVEQQRDVVRVRLGDATPASVLEVDHVVIAAGSWSKRVRVAGVAPIPVRPIRGQLLQLRMSANQLPGLSVWGKHCYTVPWPDGSLLVGATVEDVGFDERATVAGVRELTSAVEQLLPMSTGAELVGVRVGLRPATADHLPLLGPLEGHDRITLATGHYRNGVLLAPYTADVVRRLVLDGDRDPLLDLTRPERPLHSAT